MRYDPVVRVSICYLEFLRGPCVWDLDELRMHSKVFLRQLS